MSKNGRFVRRTIIDDDELVADARGGKEQARACGEARETRLDGGAAGLFALTLGMCAASATGAIMKVMKLDPAMVFNR